MNACRLYICIDTLVGAPKHRTYYLNPQAILAARICIEIRFNGTPCAHARITSGAATLECVEGKVDEKPYRHAVPIWRLSCNNGTFQLSSLK